jgi:2-C-methyl-D-erythritol 2,4-cyclodiphosphate synthase
MMRIGHGYDVHRLVEGRDLILGGVKIPHELGLLGHSDADVCVHALMDAILGAAAFGDIGQHFPDTDPQYKGADSLELLREVCELIEDLGYALVNADITIIAQKPKLAPYIAEMRENIADVCGTDICDINVKATTTEKLGFEGREEGISSHAVVLLSKAERPIED